MDQLGTVLIGFLTLVVTVVGVVWVSLFVDRRAAARLAKREVPAPPGADDPSRTPGPRARWPG